MPSETSLYDILCQTFREPSFFELDVARRPLRARPVQWEYEQIKEFLPHRGGVSFSLDGILCRAQVYQSQGYFVCAVFTEPQGFRISESIRVIAELYFSAGETPIQKLNQYNSGVFLSHLFRQTASNPANTALLAIDLNLDLSLSRMVTVFQVRDGLTLDLVQEPLRQLLNPGSQDIFGAVYDDCIVYCKVVQPDFYRKLSRSREYFENIIQSLPSSCSGKVFCGLGAVVDSADAYPSTLRFAMQALEGKTPVGWAHRDILHFLMDHISVETLQHFFTPYVQYLEENPTMVPMLQALVDCNMDLAAAAADCHIHRNTLILRLNQLRTIWDINPIQNDNDRFLVAMLVSYYKATFGNPSYRIDQGCTDPAAGTSRQRGKGAKSKR